MYISERSQEGVTKIEQIQARGMGVQILFFYDNLIIESPHQKVLAIFKRKSFPIIFPFSNNFLIIIKNMPLNNMAQKMKFSIKDFLS